MQNAIYVYTAQQAIEDGVLVELFKERWPMLTRGKPILATSNIYNEFSLAAFFEMWNEYVTDPKRMTSEMFETKMNGKKVWLVDDGSAYTFMFPEDY